MVGKTFDMPMGGYAILKREFGDWVYINMAD